jgi:nucleotide-binding universal stress UspA family protein
MSGLQIRTLVFPTDFSDCSRHAAKRAADVARHFHAQVHVVHVDVPIGPPTPAARLAAAAAELGADLDVTTTMMSGVPAHAICAYAQRVSADLIVMGTHGRIGVSRAVLGSVAEVVVRHARCAVMTIPALEVVPGYVTMAPPTREGRCVVGAKPSQEAVGRAAGSRAAPGKDSGTIGVAMPSKAKKLMKAQTVGPRRIETHLAPPKYTERRHARPGAGIKRSRGVMTPRPR